MKRRLFVVMTMLFAGLSLGPAALAANPPLILEPSSQWVADYAEDSCTLYRKFGIGEGETTVLIHRFDPSDQFRLTIAGNWVETKGTRTVEIQFGPLESAQKQSFIPGNLGKLPALVILDSMRLAPLKKSEIKARQNSGPNSNYGIPPFSNERLQAITYLSISKSGETPVILNLGPMDKSMAALSTCIDDLLSYWGIDVEKHKNLTREVRHRGSPGSWVNQHDYPKEMLSESQPALVQFRLNVSETGKPTACHIQKTTRPEEFDDAVCKSLMKRARFSPALDKDGQPIASFWINTVVFQLPHR